MVHGALAACLLLSPQAPEPSQIMRSFPLARAEQVAATLLSQSEQGLTKETSNPSTSPERPVVGLNHELEKDLVKLEYRWGSCLFHSDGSLRFYIYHANDAGIRPKDSLGPVLARVQCEELLRRYYKAAGYEDEIKLREVHQFSDQGAVRELFIEGVRTWHGIAFASGVSATLQPVSGRLLALHVGGRIAPPDHGPSVPVVGQQEAADAMMAALFETTDVPEAQLLKEPELVIRVPPGGSSARFDRRTPGQRAAGERLQGMLVYEARIFDRSSWSQELQGFTQAYDVYVDARTGRALSAFYDSAGSGGTRRVRADKPLQLGPATVRLSSGASRVLVRQARVEPRPAPSETAEGKRLTLNVGKVWMPARFDSKSGLLWVERGGKRVYGKPNKPLLEALRKLTRSATAKGSR